MKKKIDIFIEEGTLELIKQRAAEEGISINDIIQDSLDSYLIKNIPKPGGRKEAYRIFCNRPIKLSKAQFLEILGENAWLR